MKGFIVGIVAACMFFLSSPPARAQERDVLRVQFSRMTPWKIGNPGKERGVDIDFMRELADRLHLDVQFVHVPFARGLELMRKGEIDLMTGVLKTLEREEFLLFIEPAYDSSSNKAFFVRREDRDTVRRFDDLYGKRIGTTFGTRYFPRFDNDMKLTKEPVRKALLNLEKLKNHRLDVVALSEVTGRLLLRKNRFADCIVQAPYVYQAENKVYMVLSETSRFAPRLKEFNAVMRELTEAGRREQIKIRYLEYLQ